jgi:flagellin
MSLGVLNNLNAIYAENNLNNTNNSLSTVLQQLSSGSKINSGADDAAGLSLVNGLQANAQALTQSKTNATEGVGILTVADGALSQVTNLLNRAVTLATEASNGTLTSSQDTAANQEYQSILSEVNNIGTTTTYNQEQVFNSQTNIYTGDSSTAGSSVDALNIASLSSSNLGDTGGMMAYSNGTNNVFLDLSSGGHNAAVTDSLGTAAQTTTITVNYMTKGADGSAVSAAANINVGAGTTFANTAQGLISAINDSNLGLTASFGTATQAGTTAVAAAQAAETTAGGGGTDTGIIISGAGVGAGTAASGANGAGEVGTVTIANANNNADADASILSGTLSIVGANGQTHNITLGTANSTDTLANLTSTINADNFGVTATYNATVGGKSADIVFTSDSSAVTVSQNSIAATGTGADVTTLTGTPTTAGTAQSTQIGVLSGVAAGGLLKFGTAASEGTYTITAAESLANIAAGINAGKFGVTATLNAAGTAVALTSADSNLTTTTTDATLVDTATNITSSQYYNVGISGTVADTSTTGGTANVGLVGNSNGSGGVATISYSDSAGVSLSSTDLSSQSDAQAALSLINSAISTVAAQDGYIGAQINTLNSVSSVLATQSENVTAAQNAVQATDYASATSNMSKYEILSQTGISALAQANSMQQEVTKLLQ